MKETPRIIDYNSKNVGRDFVDEIEELILKHKSFFVNVERGKQQTAVLVLERAIEAQGLKCRVVTANRGWVAGGITLLTLGAGAAAWAAMGIHNLATANPDYEIVKNMFDADISVEYVGKEVGQVQDAKD